MIVGNTQYFPNHSWSPHLLHPQTKIDSCVSKKKRGDNNGIGSEKCRSTAMISGSIWFFLCVCWFMWNSEHMWEWLVRGTSWIKRVSSLIIKVSYKCFSVAYKAKLKEQKKKLKRIYFPLSNSLLIIAIFHYSYSKNSLNWFAVPQDPFSMPNKTGTDRNVLFSIALTLTVAKG